MFLCCNITIFTSHIIPSMPYHHNLIHSLQIFWSQAEQNLLLDSQQYPPSCQNHMGPNFNGSFVVNAQLNISWELKGPHQPMIFIHSNKSAMPTSNMLNSLEWTTGYWPNYDLSHLQNAYAVQNYGLQTNICLLSFSQTLGDFYILNHME